MAKEDLPFDYNKICRLCMTEEPKMMTIFTEEPGIVPLPLRIMACVSIEITAADSLPSLICSTCLHQIDNWYKFKDLCESADSLLKRMLNSYPFSIDEISKVQEFGRELKSNFMGPKMNLDEHSCTPESDQNQQLNSSNKTSSFENIENWNEEELKIPDFAEEGNTNPLDVNTDECDVPEPADDDYSSDDCLTLLAHKKKLLKEKKTRKYKRMKKKNTEEDGEEEVGVPSAEDTEEDRKKRRNKRTQTQGAKKRFRIRPAVPSACTLCDKVYKNPEILRQHMKSHHVTGTIECQQCQTKFTSLRSLKYHEQRNHSNLEPVPCSFCGKKFLDKKYLRIHENIHSQATQYVCQFCGRKFIMKTNLTVHISRHHTQKTNDFICQVCGKAFPFKLYLKKHFKTHTDYKPHSCSHCEARFRESTLLRKHINSIHLKLRPFLCYYCQKTFTRSLYLREHMESQHLGIPKKVECLRCGENFHNRSKLRQHECNGRVQRKKPKSVSLLDMAPSDNHAKEARRDETEESENDLMDLDNQVPSKKRKLNYADVTYDHPVPNKNGKVHQCRVCHKFLKNVTTRNRHEKERHPPPLICDFCGKTLTSVLSYSTHRNVHLGLTKYKCKFCGRHFASRSNLIDHERVHTGERPIPCPQCDKSFSNTSNLRVHLKFHANVKKYFCHVCGMGHVTIGNLKLHVKRHINERNHICHICGKGFNGKSELNKHLRSHDQVKHFACEYCFQRMKTANSLRRHINIQHLKIKPHKCEVCEKEFGRRENLREHMMLHSIKKEFTCNLCSKEFTHLRHLKKHKCD